MIYSITGDLVLTEPSAAVIECGGMAYRMTISSNTLGKLSSKSGKVKLFTYLKVSEDNLELFGFFEEKELDSFKLLISVSGVGPKAAIAILSVLSPEKLAIAISCGDSKAIAAANGVGNKTAQRVILELKDKFAKVAATGDEILAAALNDAPAGENKLSEAMNALMVLGYTRSEAVSVLKNVDIANLSLEDCITAALKKLMK